MNIDFKISQLYALITTLVIFGVTTLVCAPAFAGNFDAYRNGLSSQQQTVQNDAQSQISTIFNNLETVGNGLNNGNTSATTLAMVDSGCRASLEYALKTHLFADIKNSLTPDISISSSVASNYLTNKLNSMGQNSLNQLCAALRGDPISSPNVDQMLGKGLRSDIIPLFLGYGQNLMNGTGIPFLTRIEIETGISERSWLNSVTSVQPLWEDARNLHHVFAQVSWYKAPDTVSDNGQKTKYDTYNAGLAYRYLTPDKKYLFGTNMFLDYAPEKDHTRMSIGVDARTSQLAISANRYMALSTWRGVNTYTEERAASGWDTEVRGQIPELPSWTALVKGYEWDGFHEGDKLFGAQAAVEYSPIPALAVRLGARDESEGGASLEAAMRFQWRFDQPMDLQLKQRTELAPVSDYVYEKVQRDNIIRVKQRRTHSTKLTVIETTGANTALESSTSSSLFVGQTLLMPVTVTTANTVGAIARLRFNDGSVLTLGQNSQALIEPSLITLITGSIQYVNNGIVQTIVVPGGTVVLHGTDLDIVSDGTDSSVRVRDGAVTFTGSASGSAELLPEQMAKSVVGVVGTIAAGSANYITHTDTVSTNIDRVADPQNGPKVSPYPYEAPRIVSQNLTPGQQIIIGLKFNDNVTVSAGTPRLTLTINGNSGFANFVSGSGTNDLMFAYTVQAADAGATTLAVTSFDKNGASVMGNGKDAVTTIADAVLPLTGSVSDVTPPSGYTVAFTTDPINNSNKTSVILGLTGAEVGTIYNFTISSSGGGTNVTGSGTVSSATQPITGLNLSGLGDGTLTVSITLTDAASNVGSAVTDTVAKDVSAPTGYAAAFTTSPINAANKAAAAFSITSAEVGSAYNYTISSSGGGTNVTGSGTIAAATEPITGLDLTGLNDGTLTVSVTLTDTSGNTGTTATNTVARDATAPSGYTPVFTTNPINASNKTAAAFNITGAEIGASYAYTISSSGGGTNVTGSGTVSSATQSITGLNLSGLGDGTFTVSVTLTDTSGNAGTAATGTTGADTAVPTGYAAAFTTSPINDANKAAGAFNITSAEVGTTYNYTISSSGGGTNVTGSGTIATATQSITGINLTGLGDGTLTVSVTLTDTAGNAGTAATGTVAKDVSAPTGYAAAFTTSPINNANKAAGAFNITSAEVGTTYNYTISSSGGGTNVTGSGTIATATQSITGINLTGLGDGTLTVSVTLTDTAGNAGTAATGTVAKDVSAPSGYSVVFTTDPTNLSNYTAAAFQFAGAEVGASYSYTISSSGGGTPVTGSGTIATATDIISAINTTPLADGTLTLSVTLTDTSTNAGTATTDTVVKDIVAPTVTSITFTNDTYEP